MGHYLIRRAVQGTGVLLGILTAVFVLMRLTGDPALVMLPPEASPEQIADFRRLYGLDQPIWMQYLSFLAGAVHGDMGMSFRYSQPAMALILERLPATVQLASTALMASIVIGIPLGAIAGLKRGSRVDNFAIAIAAFGQAMPSFWFGIILILVFAVHLKLLPTGGYGELNNVILPAVTLALPSLAANSRLVRSAVIEVLGQDYVRTAHSKGLPRFVVLTRHTLRNALLPAVTMLGLELAALLSGTVIVETVFAWPGMGRLAVQSILVRDYPVVLAAVMISGIIYVLANLLVDLTYSLLDPRVKLT